MNIISVIIAFSYVAGLPILIGGAMAARTDSRSTAKDSALNRWVVAFGGGALVSAIAFALVPRALEMLPAPELALVFLGGTLAFAAVDIGLSKSGSSVSQVLSMMMDFIPEALALGASFAHDHRFGLLLAAFIGLQNLPEGFNAYFELRRSLSRNKVLILMAALSFTGVIAALLGYILLTDRPELIAGIMLFAAGGIIYLIFQDIAPLSRKGKDWLPATGASVGFLLGMFGEKMLL